MNPLDAIIVFIIIVSMAAGIRRGFIIGVYDMIVAVVSLVFAALAYHQVGSLVGGVVDLSSPALNLIGFIAAYTIVALPGTVLLRPVVAWFRSLTGIIPGVHPLDRGLGVIPGAIQGIVVAFVVVLATGFFTVSSVPGDWLSDSRLGLRMYRTGTGTVLDAAGEAGFGPSEFFALTRQAQGGSHVLPFQEDAADLSISVPDEERMLELVNRERAAAGLPLLQADPELTAVG
ncbi:MAG: CvpA family protein [Thermomicrobiales bacterium]